MAEGNTEDLADNRNSENDIIKFGNAVNNTEKEASSCEEIEPGRVELLRNVQKICVRIFLCQ